MLRLCILPQGEVGGVALLVLSVQLTGSVQYVVQVAAGQLAVVVVVVVLGHVEVDGTLAFVGISVLQYLLYQFNLLDDVSRCLRLDAGTQYAQGIHSLVVTVGVILCHFHRLQLFQTCLLGYLVLAFVRVVFQVAHVGNVAHIAHFISQVLEVAEEDIEGDGRTGVSQVRVAIDRRAADVHTHVWGVQRLEYFLRSAQCVVNRQLMFHIVRYLFPVESTKLLFFG